MKFHGKIGFWVGDKETSPGIWTPNIEERRYYGDILQNSRRFQPRSNDQNDDLTVNNRFSILSDLYLRENFNSIRYVVWNGVKLSVSNVEIGYPRITLEVGGVYNGETTFGTS